MTRKRVNVAYTKRSAIQSIDSLLPPDQAHREVMWKRIELIFGHYFGQKEAFKLDNKVAQTESRKEGFHEQVS